jgi:hypothetical protein
MFFPQAKGLFYKKAYLTNIIKGVENFYDFSSSGMKKVKVAIFLVFTHIFQLSKQNKFWTKNADNFHNALIFFQILTISKMKTRTQIFP